MTAAWLACTILPTATFAAIFNVDRYFFVPLIGVALFAGLLVHALTMLPEGTKYLLLAGLCLAAYVSAGVSQLVFYRELWRKAGIEAAMVVRETTLLCSAIPTGSELDVINVTRALDPLGTVFINGLSEALYASGLPSSVRILRNFSAPDSQQQRLVADLLRCAIPSQDGVKGRTMVIETGGHVLKLDPECASAIVDADRAQRPDAWALLDSVQ
jgi:hypothetical protein